MGKDSLVELINTIKISVFMYHIRILLNESVRESVHQTQVLWWQGIYINVKEPFGKRNGPLVGILDCFWLYTIISA